MDVVAVQFALVVVALAVDVHEVELVDQAVALEPLQGSEDGAVVDAGVEFLGLGQERGGIQMFVGVFHPVQNGATRWVMRIRDPRSGPAGGPALRFEVGASVAPSRSPLQRVAIGLRRNFPPDQRGSWARDAGFGRNCPKPSAGGWSAVSSRLSPPPNRPVRRRCFCDLRARPGIQSQVVR